MQRFAVVLLVLALSGASLSADLLIVEKNVTSGGPSAGALVRTMHVKGTRMRIEFARDGKTLVTVYDLPAGEIVEMDAAKRKAIVRGIAARYAKLEKEYPRARTTVSVAAAGTSRTIADVACNDQTFAIRVPMSKDGSVAATLKGTACVTIDTAVAAEYAAFAAAANTANLVLGEANDNYIVLAVTRGQTELYRALTAQGGMPLAIDIAFGVDGKGMLAGLVRKFINGNRVTTVSRIDTVSRDEALFALPGGWKRERK